MVVVFQQADYFRGLGLENLKKPLFWIDLSYIFINALVGLYMAEFYLYGYSDEY